MLSLEAIRLGAIIVTVFHLLALAVNHYIGIARPLHYAGTKSGLIMSVGYFYDPCFVLLHSYHDQTNGYTLYSHHVDRTNCRSFRLLLLNWTSRISSKLNITMKSLVQQIVPTQHQNSTNVLPHFYVRVRMFIGLLFSIVEFLWLWLHLASSAFALLFLPANKMSIAKHILKVYFRIRKSKNQPQHTKNVKALIC